MCLFHKIDVHVLFVEMVNFSLQSNSVQRIIKQDEVFIGSDFMTLILMPWVFSHFSLSALCPSYLIAFWLRKMKIECSKQSCPWQTARRTMAFLELLTEPKIIMI